MLEHIFRVTFFLICIYKRWNKNVKRIHILKGSTINIYKKKDLEYHLRQGVKYFLLHFEISQILYSSQAWRYSDIEWYKNDDINDEVFCH